MSRITKIEMVDNKIVVTFESLGRTLRAELTQRYCIWVKSRWDFEKLELIRYFINKGQKGCYLGDGENWVSPKEYKQHFVSACDIEVWDLSLIFPNVSFIENDNIKEQIMEKMASEKYQPLCDNI